MGQPSISRIDAQGTARAAVLVLHGGTPRSVAPVTGTNLSWRRAGALQRALAGQLRREGIAVWLLRYARRGWNDPGAPAPVQDARWALDRVREHDDLPIVLVGHSMGARTGARVADDPSVLGLVGLAPWFPPGEPVGALRGKDLVVAHGRRDRITSFAASQDFVRRAGSVARSTEFHDMGMVGHYLLREIGAWNGLAAGSVRGMLVHDRA
ncbi:alpha/beta hydrolase [Nocardioides sp. MH1]|uniref:alpha/beta hydrolase n=1 Tax=Nocardioides sp. MH1 TaxID=3242490 RepID=UPI003522BB5A